MTLGDETSKIPLQEQVESLTVTSEVI